jgi:hypothetical protein
MGGSAKH